MLRATMTEPGQIEYSEVEKPGLQNKRQVIVRVERIGVCGSDIHVVHGKHPYTSYPVIQGHEVSGVIEEAGQDSGLLSGQKVTIQPQVVCGQCYPCKHGMYHICESLKVMGFQTDGAGQEFFAVDADKILPLPDDMDLDAGALIEPISVGVHALGRVGGVEGKRVIVFGAGTIGNLTAQSALALGAEAVMITDVSDYKITKARECGIELAVNTRRDSLEEAIQRHFGESKADLMMECVGAQDCIDQAVRLARKGTTIGIVGVFGDVPRVDLGLVQDHELSLIGSLMYQKPDFEKAIELAASGQLRLGPMVTHRFGFRQWLDAYKTIEDSHGEYLKVMIDVRK